MLCYILYAGCFFNAPFMTSWNFFMTTFGDSSIGDFYGGFMLISGYLTNGVDLAILLTISDRKN